jgi:predicted nucleic acid-binding protein
MGIDQSIKSLMNMGWYLDTSIFMDFIDTNIRVGFDTAEVFYGHTLLHVSGTSKSAIRSFAPVLANGRRFTFELTKNMDLLRFIQYSNKILYFYSELTKAEIFRSLRKTYPQRDISEILDWWKAFCFLLSDYKKIETDFQIDQELSSLALNFPIRKNVQDYLHIMIAKKNGLAILTSDKLDNQISELQEKYYPYIYYWPEIKDNIPLDDVFKQLPM